MAPQKPSGPPPTYLMYGPKIPHLTTNDTHFMPNLVPPEEPVQ